MENEANGAALDKVDERRTMKNKYDHGHSLKRYNHGFIAITPITMDVKVSDKMTGGRPRKSFFFGEIFRSIGSTFLYGFTSLVSTIVEDIIMMACSVTDTNEWLYTTTRLGLEKPMTIRRITVEKIPPGGWGGGGG